MKAAAVGLRAHSGWTALVAVALEKGEPIVLSRQRPHLVKTFSYTFRQPYHTAARMSLEEAPAFLEGQRAEAGNLGIEALRSAQGDVTQQGYKITCAALLIASGRVLPELEKVLSAHSLIHTADGELFRGALVHACKRCKLALTCIKERELFATASRILKRKPEALANFLNDLGKPLGSPWTQDEKLAALGAWLALAKRTV